MVHDHVVRRRLLALTELLVHSCKRTVAVLEIGVHLDNILVRDLVFEDETFERSWLLRVVRSEAQMMPSDLCCALIGRQRLCLALDWLLRRV